MSPYARDLLDKANNHRYFNEHAEAWLYFQLFLFRLEQEARK